MRLAVWACCRDFAAPARPGAVLVRSPLSVLLLRAWRGLQSCSAQRSQFLQQRGALDVCCDHRCTLVSVLLHSGFSGLGVHVCHQRWVGAQHVQGRQQSWRRREDCCRAWTWAANMSAPSCDLRAHPDCEGRHDLAAHHVHGMPAGGACAVLCGAQLLLVVALVVVESAAQGLQPALLRGSSLSCA